MLPIPRSPRPAIATTPGQRLCRQVLTSGCVWSLLVARILPNLPPVPSVTWDPCSNANVNLLKAALSTRWAVAITQLHPDGKRHTTHPSPNVRNAIIGDHTMLRDEWNAAAIEADEANEAMPYPCDWRAAQIAHQVLWAMVRGARGRSRRTTSSSSTCLVTSRNWRHQSCRGRNGP